MARKKTPYECDNEISLSCTLYSIDQGEFMMDFYDWTFRGRFIYNLAVCGICTFLLFIVSLRFMLTSKKTTSSILEAEKRLLVITIIELFLAIAYVITVFSV
uniref:Uncharacterized protein n=1 Tax=Panagrolaimus davidi TaxID=227884 RepID=A0A914Q7I7_9BILA